MSYEVQDFEKDVLQASYNRPVVVDFWAEWCGPCRMLGPVIERLAGDANGRWKLAKVDTDRQPDAAIQYGVRGIPNVKMFFEGEVIAEFSGARPEHIIRQWLEQHLPADGAAGSDWAGEVKALLSAGEFIEARNLLEGKFDPEQSGNSMRVRLALSLLPDRLEEAEQLVQPLHAEPEFLMEVEALETIGHLQKVSNNELALNSENEEALSFYLQGASALFEMKFENALEAFIESLQRDRSIDEDGARKACLALFTILTDQHPLSIKYRRRFSMSLY